jgi:hypothetical protein
MTIRSEAGVVVATEWNTNIILSSPHPSSYTSTAGKQ